MTKPYTLIASGGGWVEGEALRQLEQTAALPGMQRVVGLPDLHPGKGTAVGVACCSEGCFYPYLIGSDIGCGVGFWMLDLPRRKAKRDYLARRLERLYEPFEVSAKWFEEHRLVPEPQTAIGTLGGSNHFAEVQVVDEVLDDGIFQTLLGLDEKFLFLTVHTGSRGLGDVILRRHTERFGAGGLASSSPDATLYLEDHDYAVRWGRGNRGFVAQRVADAIGTNLFLVSDVCHNSITRHTEFDCWLHRKGAAAADQGCVVVPGTRGSYSYLVCPRGDGVLNLASIAHGAGRRWNRSSVRGRLAHETRESLQRTKIGSIVMCRDLDALYEEAPQAFKDIDDVMADMVTADIIKVVARLKPLVTFKD